MGDKRARHRFPRIDIEICTGAINAAVREGDERVCGHVLGHRAQNA
ncbi:hypothetical protein RB2083_2441 [Rhodobacteraceae bacterium HTCC2083]|nr:hypothetical protein RB2083_2441 [Rhodobacteraceae bacterium HTCC2083]